MLIILADSGKFCLFASEDFIPISVGFKGKIFMTCSRSMISISVCFPIWYCPTIPPLSLSGTQFPTKKHFSNALNLKHKSTHAGLPLFIFIELFFLCGLIRNVIWICFVIHASLLTDFTEYLTVIGAVGHNSHFHLGVLDCLLWSLELK